ncbi:MAG: tRNA pseudouridine(55) synthase TruB [Mycobacteriales bacterium]
MTRPGLVVVDKPGGMTSHDVVARVRRIAATRKVGHAGTLDPMATGVLILGVERATKLLGYVAGHDKTYLATIRLGAATVTDDAEGDIVATADASRLDDGAVRRALGGFVGAIDQVPSAVSAIKLGGVRSYARVRAGESVDLAARRVRIDRIDVLAIRPGSVYDLDIEVDCSTGTYIRALARDLGTTLGVGGHLTALRRTRIGAFSLAAASTLDELAESAEPVPIGIDTAMSSMFARRDLTPEEVDDVTHGRRIEPVGLPAPYGAFDSEGRAVALLEERGGQARTVVVIRPTS